MWCGLYALDTCNAADREKFITDTTDKIVRRLNKDVQR